MLAGGYGNISAQHTKKHRLHRGTVFIHLGGPGFLIGLGGGAASSMASGQNVESLDFDSVQRANAELGRRCQEVIDACWQMGSRNPILSIHDVGAGGLSNAFPELVHSGGVGGHFEMRAIPIEEPGMSPMQIWSNESQERYVLAIDKSRLADFERICMRERCLFAVVGEARNDARLVVPSTCRSMCFSASRRACTGMQRAAARGCPLSKIRHGLSGTPPTACYACPVSPTRHS
jgi:phosphoribosylformylglycinamidine synthase